MKPFYFALEIHHYRDLRKIGICTGVVFAEDIDIAKEKAWKEHGGDNCCNLDCWEIPEEGTSYTVWKGSFPDKAGGV